LFGVSPANCSRLWDLIKLSLPPRASPRHLLWALFFLKQYAHEVVNANFAQCDEKTFRKWCWIVLTSLADVDLVSAVMQCCCLAGYATLTCLFHIFSSADCFLYLNFLFFAPSARLGE
jgi:hypothetical protein